jgi:glycosyltransferase involved in cell wall biosynthesis
LSSAALPRLRIALEASALLPPRTGIGRYTALLARQFARRDDVELHLLINAWLPKYWRAFSALKREFTGPRVRWHMRPLPGRLTRRLDRARGGWRLAPPPDIVHGPNYLLPRLTRGAGVITINDLYFLENMEEIVSHNFRSELPDSVARARSIIAISETTAAKIRFFFPNSGARISVIPLGVEDGFRMPAAAAPPPLPEKFFLSVGTTGTRKNLPFIAPALAAAPGRSWVVIGPAGDDERPLRQACDRAGVALLRLPWLPDEQLNGVYRRAEALLAPSRQEGYFYPAFEASVCGCPVVASDIAIFREAAARHRWSLCPPELAAWRERLAEPERLPRPVPAGILDEAGVAAAHLEVYRAAKAG